MELLGLTITIFSNLIVVLPQTGLKASVVSVLPMPGPCPLHCAKFRVTH